MTTQTLLPIARFGIPDGQPATITAAARFQVDPTVEPGAEFEAVLVVEGERTTDDREIALGALGWRELPIPLMFQIDDQDSHGGVVVGKITEITRVNGSDRNEIRARGTFDLGSADGREAARLVGEQIIRWVSIDLEVIDYEMIFEGDCDLPSGEPDEVEDLFFPEDCSIIMRVTSGRIMGAAIVAFPAFPSAVIVPAGAEIPAASNDGRPEPAPAVAAAGGPAYPPAEWFAPPGDEPTPLTITDEGRIVAHAALWGVCHIGIADVCLTAPRSEAAYAYFATGATRVACDCGDTDHDQIATGVITLDTGHAPLAAGAKSAAAHYDDTGTAVADVAVGEDAHGIWIAGALRPGLSDEQVRRLRGSSLSGDWRRIGGSLELVALLAVNVPGFPVPRAHARVASGEQTALVAAAGPRPVSETERLRARVVELEAWRATLDEQLAYLRPAVRDGILASLEPETSP